MDLFFSDEPEDKRTPAQRAAADAEHERQCIIKSYQRQTLESLNVIEHFRQIQARANTLDDRLARAAAWMNGYTRETPHDGIAMVQFMGFQTEVHTLPQAQMNRVVKWMRKLDEIGLNGVLACQDAEPMEQPGFYSFKIADDLRVIAASIGDRVFLLALA